MFTYSLVRNCACSWIRRRNKLAMGAVAGVSDWTPLLGYLDHMNFCFFWRWVCRHAFFFFCERVRCVCLHGLRVCIIVFSARLAVPVCARVQVAHDPGSAGRSMSFMSPVQFSLKSGSKDKRITPICCDTHTHTHTQTHTGLFLKNDFLEIWVVTRWHRGGRWGGQLFKIHLM